MNDRIATDAWSVMGNDSQHRYPIITPKHAGELLEAAGSDPVKLYTLCESLLSAMVDLNTVVASYKWQLKTLKADNDALRAALIRATL